MSLFISNTFAHLFNLPQITNKFLPMVLSQTLQSVQRQSQAKVLKSVQGKVTRLQFYILR